jgi:hypothetical protein
VCASFTGLPFLFKGREKVAYWEDIHSNLPALPRLSFPCQLVGLEGPADRASGYYPTISISGATSPR